MRAADKLHDVARSMDKGSTAVAAAAKQGARGCSFVPETEVLTGAGGVPIGDLQVGDVVIAHDESASTVDPWRLVIVPEGTPPAAAGPPERFDPLTATWTPITTAPTSPGVYRVAGQLLHIEPDGRQVSRGPSSHASARNATIVWKPRDLHPPTADDTVWLLIDGAQAGPWSLATLADGLPIDGEPVQVAYLSTVFELRATPWGPELRRTPEVLSRVTHVFDDTSERLVELTLSHADGETTVEQRLVGTPEHPVYSPQLGWVPLGELPLGERLHTSSGTDALLVGSTWWPATVADRNLEVAYEHLLRARSGGGRGWGAGAQRRSAEVFRGRAGGCRARWPPSSGPSCHVSAASPSPTYGHATRTSGPL
jgi:hypothetical protein